VFAALELDRVGGAGAEAERFARLSADGPLPVLGINREVVGNVAPSTGEKEAATTPKLVWKIST
jgi:hypothetical protein